VGFQKKKLVWKELQIRTTYLRTHLRAAGGGTQRRERSSYSGRVKREAARQIDTSQDVTSEMKDNWKVKNGGASGLERIYHTGRWTPGKR